MAMVLSFGGVDPGLSGGFVVVSGDKIKYKIAMPTLRFTTKEGKIKTEIDRDGVLSFLSILPPHTHVAIEEQMAFRKQNIVASCTQCKNYGILQMALTVSHMFCTEVPSEVWHEYFGIVSAKEGKGSTKEQGFDIVKMLYPDEDFRKSDRSHKFHDGMVDATLLAYYCQSRFNLSFIRELPADEPPVDETPLEVKPIKGVEGLCKPLECKPGGKEKGTKLRRRIL